MKITCENCGVLYKISDSHIKPNKSVKTQCPKCKHIQTTRNNRSSFEDQELTIDNSDAIFQNNINSNSFEDQQKTLNRKNLIDTDNEQKSSEVNIKKFSEISLPDIDIDKLNEDQEKLKDKKKQKFDLNDEFSEDLSTSKIYYKARKGGTFLGPFIFNEIIDQIKSGKVTKEWLFSKGDDDWRGVEKYPELLSHFPGRITHNKSIFPFLKSVVKYLLIISAIGGVAFGTYYFLQNKNKIVKQIVKKDNIKEKVLYDEYIDRWKKNIIISKSNNSEIFLNAIENYYKDREDFYIKAVQQFKEVLVKNPLKKDAFYHFIIAISLSSSNIEKDKDIDNFLKILNSFRNQDNKNPLLYLAFSAIQYKLGKFSDSYNNAIEAYKIMPTNPVALYFIGLSYLVSKPEKSIDYFKKSIKLDSRFKPSIKSLSKAFILSNNYQDAVSYYKNDTSNYSKYVLSKIYLKLGYYKRAINTLKYLERLKNNIISAKILLAASYYQFEKNYKKAFLILKKLKKDHFFQAKKDEKINILKHLSIIYRLKGNYQKSIELSVEILKIHKNNSVAIFNLSLCYISLKNYTKAEYYINKFSQFDENFNKNFNLLKYEFFMAKKEYSLAIKEINRLISIERYNNIYYLLKAEASLKNGNIDLANTAIYELNRIDPDYYIRNHLKLNDFFIGFYDPSIILQLYDKALKIKDVDKDILVNNIGIIYYQIRKYDKAKFYLTKAIELNPKNYSNYLYLAATFYSKKRYKKVDYYINKAIELNDANPIVYLIGIKNSVKMKDFDKAKKMVSVAKFRSNYSPFLELAEAIYNLGINNEDKALLVLKKLQNYFGNDYFIKNLIFTKKI